MSAANQTWTLDVAGQKYVDKDGIEHIINTNETFLLDFTDTGVGGVFVGRPGGGKITCTDKFEFEPSSDSRFQFVSSVDGVATGLNGSIAFIEEGNVLNEFEVTSLNISNADGVGTDNVTSITLEQIANRMRKMTWVTIDTA